MDGTPGTARLPGVNGVLLVQTDTTVGFVSQDTQALACGKSRPASKPFLKTYASFKAYRHAGRIPSRFKREVRRTEKTTYIVKSSAFRIVGTGPYHRLLASYGWLYSTSANASGARFDPGFARDKADAIIEDERGLYEDVPSNIYKITQRKKRRMR